jgi:hypothetical protein
MYTSLMNFDVAKINLDLVVENQKTFKNIDEKQFV